MLVDEEEVEELALDEEEAALDESLVILANVSGLEKLRS